MTHLAFCSTYFTKINLKAREDLFTTHCFLNMKSPCILSSTTGLAEGEHQLYWRPTLQLCQSEPTGYPGRPLPACPPGPRSPHPHRPPGSCWHRWLRLLGTAQAGRTVWVEVHRIKSAWWIFTGPHGTESWERATRKSKEKAVLSRSRRIELKSQNKHGERLETTVTLRHVSGRRLVWLPFYSALTLRYWLLTNRKLLLWCLVQWKMLLSPLSSLFTELCQSLSHIQHVSQGYSHSYSHKWFSTLNKKG